VANGKKLGLLIQSQRVGKNSCISRKIDFLVGFVLLVFCPFQFSDTKNTLSGVCLQLVLILI
jgi:hypothetical protein